MSIFCRISLLFLFLGFFYPNAQAQRLLDKRSSFYSTVGISGAKLNQFDNMLADRGLSGLRQRYRTIGLGYQTRINDFVLGMELFQNRSAQSRLDDYRIGYRTSRAVVNIGYSFTEEGKFQLIHYMSMGLGFLNFQMLPDDRPSNLDDFLADPADGFILRKMDIHKGTKNFGGFLTEIGFQLSYDFNLLGRKEALFVLAKMGYSFSPFEGKWEMNDMSFDNTQAGAFFRVGAGVTLPDRNFFYKDASVTFQLLSGIHFTKADGFNEQLVRAGYEPLEGRPSNLGLRMLVENGGFLYGSDVFNLSSSGTANEQREHSLNSLRVYALAGHKVIQFRNFSIAGLAGLGFGNLRYSLLQKDKPDFPELFEKRKFDGYLRNSGLMAKPELMVEYGMPVTKRKLFDLVFSASFGYELALANYRLGEFDMANYMSAPYLMFGIGVRP
ncbi:hypothetical protein [Algoriphagus hitonicola]|uniref:Uncharacterized protein n=1 Tax=Algoriphagus hitonicola TaxID=435880 RepID=A0A1I2TVN3_9BACT|nr:hypothetical protein [Algoriphagus hitonicola]SFG66596.1 hypothetical protein SAMN04487988_106131 [Algoriphagus hitonicola]